MLILPAMNVNAQDTDDHFSHTDSTTAPAENVWRIWTDVSNWKQWDNGVREAMLNGDFVAGARGRLVPDKGPRSKFMISEVNAGIGYTFKTKIPFGWLVVKRTLHTTGEKTFFTHEVSFTGPFKKLFGKTLGKRYRAVLPTVLTNIRNLAEHR